MWAFSRPPALLGKFVREIRFSPICPTARGTSVVHVLPRCPNLDDRLNGSRYSGIALRSGSLEAVLLQWIAVGQTAVGGVPPVGASGIHRPASTKQREYVQADPRNLLTDGTPRRPQTRQTSTTPGRPARAVT
jgi:hypothetical protein